MSERREGKGGGTEVACAKCGGRTRAGHLFWNAPVRFKPAGASQFRRGTAVRAFACESCGHVELALEQ